MDRGAVEVKERMDVTVDALTTIILDRGYFDGDLVQALLGRDAYLIAVAQGKILEPTPIAEAS